VSRNWFYTHDGRTHGPVSTDEIKRLAASHLLLPDDLLWPEGLDRDQAVSAAAAFDYATPLPPTAPVPDWLDDIHKAELSGIQLLPPSSIPMPDWLDDIRTVEQGAQLPTVLPFEEEQLPAVLPLLQEQLPTVLPVQPPVPDWLDSLQPAEPRRRAAPPPAPPVEPIPPVPTQVVPSAPPAVAPPAAPVPLAEPLKPAPVEPPIPTALPVKPAPAEKPIPLATPVKTIPMAMPVPLATPAPPPVVNPPTAPPVAPPPPAAPVEETGLDLRTGQVLDAAKFKAWEQRKRQHRQRELESQPGLPYAEIFRKAQRELETWIDADENQELVLRAPLDQIQRHPQVQEILQHYRSHGQELVNRLTRHVHFVVDNRRKYHEAMKKK
jgi:hypothetical protein